MVEGPNFDQITEEWQVILNRQHKYSIMILQGKLESKKELLAKFTEIRERHRQSKQAWISFSASRRVLWFDSSRPTLRDCCECFAKFPAKLAFTNQVQFRQCAHDLANSVLAFSGTFLTQSVVKQSEIELFEGHLSIDSEKYAIDLKEIQTVRCTSPTSLHFSLITGAAFTIKIPEDDFS
jgi:hypothetical protein